MTLTVALFIFALGLVIGYHLPTPVAALRAWWRRLRYQPKILQPEPKPDVPTERAPYTTPE